jgi:hypothetical protein
MKPDDESQLISFEATFEPCPPGTLATPRPPGRPRDLESGVGREGIFVSFEATDVDTAFARELADRVLEYVRNQPTALTATQLAALVQDLITRRLA